MKVTILDEGYTFFCESIEIETTNMYSRILLEQLPEEINLRAEDYGKMLHRINNPVHIVLREEDIDRSRAKEIISRFENQILKEMNE